ncbi:hypothetical protein ACX0G7_07310 [Flavitalea antarctica]
MRVLLLIFGCLFFLAGSAQQGVPLGIMNNTQMGGFPHFSQQTDSNTLNRKWSLNKYAGISSSFGFYNGGSTSMISAPVGLQLNRMLSKNLYAFAGVSVAPSYFTYNRSFNDFNIYKTNPGNSRINSNGFGIYSRVEAGLMYINDEKTFSISGSIGMDRSTYPIYPANSRVNRTTQQPFVGSR